MKRDLIADYLKLNEMLKAIWAKRKQLMANYEEYLKTSSELITDSEWRIYELLNKKSGTENLTDEEEHTLHEVYAKIRVQVEAQNNFLRSDRLLSQKNFKITRLIEAIEEREHADTYFVKLP